MIRIEEALRRARALEQGVAPPDPPQAGDDPPVSEQDTEVLSPAAGKPEPPASVRTRLRTAVAGSTFTRIVQSRPDAPAAHGDAQRLLTNHEIDESATDSFRSLAAALHESQFDRALTVLTVTSSVSGEGKSLVSANLALTLSRSYHRNVLLIDADLRRPGLHHFFSVPQEAGLVSALRAVSAGATVAVHEVAKRVALIPAGRSPQDPVSTISSDSMYQLVAAAASAFDWVILDAPPVGMMPDAGLISRLGDAVLLVVEAGRVEYRLVQRTVESLGADRIFGVVLNKVHESELRRIYGHEYYYAPYGQKPE